MQYPQINCYKRIRNCSGKMWRTWDNYVWVLSRDCGPRPWHADVGWEGTNRMHSSMKQARTPHDVPQYAGGLAQMLAVFPHWTTRPATGTCQSDLLRAPAVADPH